MAGCVEPGPLVYAEFMVLPLHETALEGVSGMVKYLPEFREAEC